VGAGGGEKPRLSGRRFRLKKREEIRQLWTSATKRGGRADSRESKVKPHRKEKPPVRAKPLKRISKIAGEEKPRPASLRRREEGNKDLGGGTAS